MSEGNGQSAALAPITDVKAAMGNRGIILGTFDELARFSRMVEASGFAPKGMTAAGIGVAIQMGLEVGLSPTQALQSTAVINGRPAIYGDAAKALVEASGLVEDFDEWFECGGKRVDALPEKMTDDCRACCMSKRKGRRERTTVFSVADAKRASLWGKTGPWSQYPARMLMWRARGFNLRDNFGDVLKGLRLAEEVRDDPVDVTGQATVTSTDEPTKGVAALAGKLRERTANVAPEPPADPSAKEWQKADSPPAEGEIVEENQDADPVEKAKQWAAQGDAR